MNFSNLSWVWVGDLYKEIVASFTTNTLLEIETFLLILNTEKSHSQKHLVNHASTTTFILRRVIREY